MKHVMWIRLFLAAVTALSLSACGGSGGGGAAPGPGITLSGVVEDGPVFKSTVYALNRDGSDGLYGPCVTDEKGRFTVTVDAGVDLKSLMLFARGGKDGTTGPDGLNFRGMVMMAPLEMYEGKTRSVVVSPVTTLVGLDVANGSSLSAARTAVAGMLKVSEEKLTARPSVEGGHFHAKTMMLSLVATARRTKGCKGSAFEGLTFSVDGLPDTTDHPELDEAVAVIKGALERGQAPGEVFVRQRLLSCLTDVLDANSPSSSKEDPAFKTRASRLIGDILAAAGGRPIHLESMAPERVIRWVLRTSGIETYDTFLGDTFPVLIGWVRDNTEIASIITPVASKYNIREPLFAGELLGDDNAKRLDYYFNSDASHLYKAEKLIETVRDDTVNDYILERVALGLAEAGFFSEAEPILDTKIFSTWYRAEGLRRLGKSLLEFKERTGSISQETVVGAFEKSEFLYKKKIESVGKAFFDDKDSSGLQCLIKGYRDAGEMDRADTLTDYMEECIAAMSESNKSALPRIIISMEKTAEAYIEEGNEAQAALYPGVMFALAKEVPADDAANPDYPGKEDDPNVVDYYRSKVFYLIRTLEIYGSLYENFGDASYRAGALKAYCVIEELRDTYPFTAEKTELYLANWGIPSLFAIGEDGIALALTDGLASKYRKKVYASQATSKAVAGEDMDGAFAVVDLITDKDPEDEVAFKVDALTYCAANSKVKRIAASLIAKGSHRYSHAVQALERAGGLLDTFTTDDGEINYKIKVQRGYVKLAYLYGLMGKIAEQKANLEKAECQARSTAGALWKVQALCDTAQGWHGLGNNSRVTLCLHDARLTADAVREGEVDATKLAETYYWLMKAYERLGYREDASEVANIYSAKSGLIFDESLTDDQWATGSYGKHDKLLEDQGRNLIKAAKVLIAFERLDNAEALLDSVIATKEAFYDDGECVDLCVGKVSSTADKGCLVYTYACAGAVEKAVDAARSLGVISEINRGVKAVAASLTDRDHFPEKSTYSPKPEHWVAQVDTDGDGLPDFFSPLASPEDIAASGLTLDPDSDGDGIPDTTDTRPLYAD
ncbi:hypothetical protein [Desulfoluna spongiiphila]|uniref:Tetratricopeptide repeat-containing protein n=1 Tax=Desulfoluna spongiiphila TaxID=419481 RepID=A0A1G5H9Y1_9BACT|nr:hypothetical protein [Desulfoluna spongiiphila]SCY60583.1 hypothetical protein SAMN05216233_11342 [Desulfoluna spongiiphila]